MKYILRTHHVDTYGDRFVVCPVCRSNIREDYMVRHAGHTKGHIAIWKWLKDRKKRPATVPKDWPWKHLQKEDGTV